MAIASIPTRTPPDRQIRYLKGSAWFAILALTAPKLHTTPAPSAISDAAIGIWVVCRGVAVAVIASVVEALRKYVPRTWARSMVPPGQPSLPSAIDRNI